MNDLAAFTDDDATGQIVGAATLLAMNVSPVVVVRIPFGGDNHESKSGLGAAGGDVPVNETLSAFGKTLGAMVGVPQAVLDKSITKGKVVSAALA